MLSHLKVYHFERCWFYWQYYRAVDSAHNAQRIAKHINQSFRDQSHTSDVFQWK